MAPAHPSMRLETVVSWLPDPRGWGIFAGLAGAARRDLQAERPVIDRSSSTYGGWAATPQRFVGMAGLLAGRARPQVSRDSQLVDQRSTLTTPAMDLFYEQVQRGRQ